MLQILMMLPYAQLQVFNVSTSVHTLPLIHQPRVYLSWVAGVTK